MPKITIIPLLKLIATRMIQMRGFSQIDQSFCVDKYKNRDITNPLKQDKFEEVIPLRKIRKFLDFSFFYSG